MKTQTSMIAHRSVPTAIRDALVVLVGSDVAIQGHEAHA